MDICEYCGRHKDDLHTGDCLLALALDYVDGCAGETYQEEARQAYERLHAEGVL